MRGSKLALLVVLLAVGVTTQNSVVTTAPPVRVQPSNRGMTLQATVFPTYENNWAGRFSCNNCNPFEGDQPCSKSLPILCISNVKVAQRPHYTVAVEYTPFAITDGGYYDGWTGGVFTVTLPVRGSHITSYAVGDSLCKGYFGSSSKFAAFDDGYYMPYMNQLPEKSWWLWDWAQAKQGGWNMWGYFNHHYRGRAWVWINNQPTGNCGI